MIAIPIVFTLYFSVMVFICNTKHFDSAAVLFGFCTVFSGIYTGIMLFCYMHIHGIV